MTKFNISKYMLKQSSALKTYFTDSAVVHVLEKFKTPWVLLGTKGQLLTFCNFGRFWITAED